MGTYSRSLRKRLILEVEFVGWLKDNRVRKTHLKLNCEIVLNYITRVNSLLHYEIQQSISSLLDNSIKLINLNCYVC